MHFVMHAFNNHVGILHNVTPIDLLDQSAVLSDGVVFCGPTKLTKSAPTHVGSLHHPNRLNASRLHLVIPLLWRGVRPVHFVMYAFSNHAVVLHNVTPIDLPAQSAVLSDGLVASYLHKAMCQTIPLLWRGVRLRPTGWSTTASR